MKKEAHKQYSIPASPTLAMKILTQTPQLLRVGRSEFVEGRAPPTVVNTSFVYKSSSSPNATIADGGHTPSRVEERGPETVFKTIITYVGNEDAD